MEKISLSVNLVNAILQYLGNQPYGAVANLVVGIQQEAAPQMAAQPVAEEPKPE